MAEKSKKSIVCYFEVQRKDLGLVPCLLPGPARILVDYKTVPAGTKSVFLIYDRHPGEPVPQTYEEALGMCDAAMC